MNLQRDMQRVFGVRAAARPTDAQSSRDAVWELSAVGYPGLFMLTVFLTPDGRRRWQVDRRVRLPPMCCFCGNPACSYLDTYRAPLLRLLKLSRPVLSKLPHCRDHAESRDASAIADIHNPLERYMSLTIVAKSRPFLEETLELCRNDGEYEPPWFVFPGKDPGAGWNQGIEEHWLRLAWSPFWGALSSEQRSSYLERWQAPNAWAVWLHKTGA